ncbi:MAG: aldehyde ferredoxin oxidoreductase [Candidatus Lokiarchaeota archaeon]|nr:aldehyde ferredoxin oxidoreductase [Candidatus Harpocratesius repetitus]
MPKLIRIDLADNHIQIEEIIKGHPYYYFGGRALSSKIIAEEVDPQINPLDESNKLIIAAGLLTGTPCPNSGRISIGAKSPLTKGIKESNVGGRAPALIGRHDIRALIFEKRAISWKILIIDAEGNLKLQPGDQFQGMNNYELADALKKEFGPKIGLFSIGTAGEKQLNSASIASIDLEGYPSRHAGRGGMGAVIGSKKLKAIVVIPPKKNKLTYLDSKSFKNEAKSWGLSVYKAKRLFSQFGTLIGLTTMNSLNALPTHNFRRGSFDDVEKISAETLYDYIQTNHGKSGLACSPGCVIKCSNLVKNSKGEHITSSLEYETVALNGSNLLINDIEKLAEIDHACDDVGVDSIEIGNAMGVFMETGKIKWGDADNVVKLINEIAVDNPDSLAIANGAVYTGKMYNIKRVAQVKGQGIPGYDPRSFKGMGVTYLTSPMGADHTAGAAITGRVPYPDKEYGKITEAEHKVELSRGLQIFTMIHDSIGQCYFMNPTFQSTPHIVTLLNAKFGWNLTPEKLIEWSKTWLKIERDYNEKVGLSPVDQFPEFMINEPLEDNQERRWDVSDIELEDYWREF